jgi:hypothetical protein
MNRREFIRVGVAAGASLPAILRAQSTNAAKATSVIQIFLPGGIAHQDAWDYKPRKTLMTPDLRPVEIVYEAQPIEQIIV